jgi:hypothetical protein
MFSYYPTHSLLVCQISSRPKRVAYTNQNVCQAMMSTSARALCAFIYTSHDLWIGQVCGVRWDSFHTYDHHIMYFRIHTRGNNLGFHVQQHFGSCSHTRNPSSSKFLPTSRYLRGSYRASQTTKPYVGYPPYESARNEQMHVSHRYPSSPLLIWS